MLELILILVFIGAPLVVIVALPFVAWFKPQWLERKPRAFSSEAYRSWGM